MHRILVNVLLLSLFALTSHGQDSITLTSSDLPIFIINTDQGIEIPNEPKIEAHLGIIYNGVGARNNITDPFSEYDGRIGIELRGNGTLVYDKVSYALETQDEFGENNNVSILGLPSENDWILYGPYIDKSLIRNALIYNLANEMGYYASRTKFCELILNGEYLGLYVFMEKIKRDGDRVDIEKFELNDSPEDGGFIIKIDSWWADNLGWQSNTYDYKDEERTTVYQYVYPKHYEITSDQAAFIESRLNSFEELMNDNDSEFLFPLYEPLIDVENFADYFLINELTKNPDGYRLSTFMHKDSEEKDSRLKLGPIWDYNFGFGNYCCDYKDNYAGWEFDNAWWEYPVQIPFWIDKLMESPEFVDVVNARWLEWRTTLIGCDSFIEEIENLSDEIEEARIRNFEKWPILGTNLQAGWNAGPDYEDETAYLKEWVCNRIQWMDNNLPFALHDESLDSVSIFPNPCIGDINIRYFTEVEENVSVRIYDSVGRILDIEDYAILEGYNNLAYAMEVYQSGIYFIQLGDKKPYKLVKH